MKGCLLCGEDYPKDSSWSSVSDDFCDGIGGKSFKSLLLEASGRKDVTGVISDDSDLCPDCCNKLKEYGQMVSRLENMRSELKSNLFQRHPALAESERPTLTVRERRARVVVTEDLKTMMIRARLLNGSSNPGCPMSRPDSLPKKPRCSDQVGDVSMTSMDSPGKDGPGLVPVSSCVFQDLRNIGKTNLAARKCVSSAELNTDDKEKIATKPKHTSVSSFPLTSLDQAAKTSGNDGANVASGQSGSGNDTKWKAIRAGDRTIKRFQSKKRASILDGIWVKRSDL